jgi:hypothetical protein
VFAKKKESEANVLKLREVAPPDLRGGKEETGNERNSRGSFNQ